MRVIVLVGTKKGAFLFESDETRRHWRRSGPFQAGWGVNHFSIDARRPAPRLWAAANHEVWGPRLGYSDDWGANWTEDGPALAFEAGSGRAVKNVWHVTPGHVEKPGEVWCGVEPAALFRSGDGGETWSEVAGLNEHATSGEWEPGGGGLILHTIVPDHSNPDSVIACISAGGAYRSNDGGASWRPINRGVPATFRPTPWPEVGQCVHKLVQSPTNPAWLFQQNHCGVYRSRDGGENWEHIESGLPTGWLEEIDRSYSFGFPMAGHRRDPETLYVVPLLSEFFRATSDGRFIVYRSRDGGDNWHPLTEGLPQDGAYLVVYRDALATDAATPGGVYAGTTGGHLFGSRDDGDSWFAMSTTLPPILSVETAVFE